MHIGIIGLGSIGERHVRNIQELYPKAVIDILTQRRSWKDAGPNTHLIASSSKFYATKHDAYFITNETGKHAETILRCLSQKPRGIFVEKPLSHTVRDVSRLRAALKKQPTVFFVAYCLQFFAPLLEIKKIIQSKQIGDILAIRASAGKDMRTWRTRDYRASYSSRKDEGGVILDLIHEINYPGWLLDDTLSFITGTSGRIFLDIAAEDIASSTYCSSHGVLVSVHQDYVQTPGRRMCEVFGTHGTATWSRSLVRGNEKNEIRVETPTRTRVREICAGGNDMYMKELRFFMQQLKHNTAFSNFEEAARDLTNVDALKKRGTRITR